MMGWASADPFAAVEDLNILGCFSDPAEPKQHLKQTVRCETSGTKFFSFLFSLKVMDGDTREQVKGEQG